MARGLRAAIYGGKKEESPTPPIENIYSGITKKIQVRMAIENYNFLEEEAKRTGSNISAIAGVLIADAIRDRINGEKARRDSMEVSGMIREVFREEMSKIEKK